jgi:hypothetical protein
MQQLLPYGGAPYISTLVRIVQRRGAKPQQGFQTPIRRCERALSAGLLSAQQANACFTARDFRTGRARRLACEKNAILETQITLTH